MSNLQNQYYQHLFYGSQFAIIGTDPQGIIISCNPVAEKFFAASSPVLLGRHLEEIVPSAQRPPLREALTHALTQRTPAETEIEQLDNGGHPRILTAVITPIVDDQQKFLGFAAWIRDVTPRKNLERQLAETEKIASLGTVAAGVAHSFNNIIGGVATYVDYALGSHDPQIARRALQITADAANSIAQITASLLTYTAQDTRHFDLCDLTEVLLTFSHLVEKPLADQKITLQLNLQAVPIYEVPGSRMHQVLGNLLDNAEYALPRGGTITISLQRQQDQLVLSFADDGMGINHQDIPHIFEPFFTTRGIIAGGNQRNFGLGLSVVHGIIRELGGTINVASTPGSGTTFTIHFPMSQSPKSDQ